MQDIARRITARPGEGKLVWPVSTRQRIALFWVTTVLSVLAVACQAASPLEADQPRATLARPYAGLEARQIRALAPERIADLLTGRGAGYALAAELNHYSGPAHVLELVDQLELTAKQERAVGTVKAAMQEEAQGSAGGWSTLRRSWTARSGRAGSHPSSSRS